MRALVLLALILPGCVGLGARESSVTLPDGKIVKIRCQSDGVVDYEQAQGDAKVKVRVDNRGPTGQVWAAGTAALGKTYDKVKEATQ